METNKTVLTEEERKEFLQLLDHHNSVISRGDRDLYEALITRDLQALLSKKMGEQELEDKQMFWHVLMRISTLKPEYIYEEVDEYIAMCQDDINKLSKLN